MEQEEFKRKLTAILSADVKEYSRLMSQDERGTIRTLTAYKEAMSKLIQEYKGRVVDAPGDNLLAEFSSVVDAVNCSVEIQRDLAERNAELPPARQMEFRIGINLGDVVEEEDRIYGDGVNIAARVEGLSEGGGICISGTVYDHVKNKLGLEYDYLGEQAVKNIPEPIRVYRVNLGAVKLSVETETPVTLPFAEKPSIAVLPFTNMSGDPEQEYFSDGITEDIITALTCFRSFSVIARNSTFIYKGKSVDVRRVADELHARYVVEGSIRKSANRVRITAQLIEAASGNHIWAERYDRDLKDIFAVQDEIVKTIAGRLGSEVDSLERQRAERKPTRNLDAWDCYYLGLSQYYKFSKEGNIEAQRLLNRAIELDPNFGPAYSRLAYNIILSMIYFDADPTTEMLDEALKMAKKSVEIDDKDAFSHLAVARVRLARGEYDLCIAECETSINLNPYLAQAYCGMGDSLAYMGRFAESIPHFEEAMHLGPHDPWRWAFYSYRSLAHIFMKQHEKAVKWATEAIRVHNCQYWANAHLVSALGHLNRIDEARAAVDELLKRKPAFSRGYARKYLFYIKISAQIEYYIDGLRKAEVPE
ncbi:MAG: adenylate/guanylate cyclase domain-containing protein [Planctomycetota bacterium]|jgi:TolB-like protein/Tfp pilus assembly protein PilF